MDWKAILAASGTEEPPGYEETAARVMAKTQARKAAELEAQKAKSKKRPKAKR